MNSVFLVILVPYGLCGSLTGNSYRETDQSASKIIEEWSQFYPLDKNDGTDVNKIPPLVEVIVGKHSEQSFQLHMYRKKSIRHKLLCMYIVFNLRKECLWFDLKKSLERAYYLVNDWDCRDKNCTKLSFCIVYFPIWPIIL